MNNSVDGINVEATVRSFMEEIPTLRKEVLDIEQNLESITTYVMMIEEVLFGTTNEENTEGPSKPEDVQSSVKRSLQQTNYILDDLKRIHERLK